MKALTPFQNVSLLTVPPMVKLNVMVVTGILGYALITRDVTTPYVPGGEREFSGSSHCAHNHKCGRERKDLLPPPPRRAQKRSGFCVSLTVTNLPFGRTTSRERSCVIVSMHGRERRRPGHQLGR